MKIIVLQGQFGLFNTKCNEFFMPAIQTCIGLILYTMDRKKLMLCHLDTSLAMDININININIKKMELCLEENNLKLKDMTGFVFGGDSRISYLRCSRPSCFIGEVLIKKLSQKNCLVKYSNYYSGLREKTYNLHIKNNSIKANFISKFKMEKNLNFVKNSLFLMAKSRISKTPDEYLIKDAIMHDISKYYN